MTPSMYRFGSVGFLLLCTGLALAGTPAGVESIGLERAVETDTTATRLPSDGATEIVVTPCPNCRPEHYAIDADTRWFVGPRRVSLSDLRAQAAGPSKNLTVLLDTHSDLVTRVILAPSLAPSPGGRP